MTLLEACGLTKFYGARRAVSDLTFALHASEVVGYLGPNGSGKSTTVNLLLGLLPPSAGRVLFHGEPIENDILEFRRHVGYVPEQPHLYPFLGGREFLELVTDLRDMDGTVAAKRSAALLELFGLASLGDTAMSEYSKGNRQKILLIAALLHDPELLLLDEPGSGLDAASALMLDALIMALASAGKGVLYCSHELHSVERTCSRALVLSEGRIIAHDLRRDGPAAKSLEAVLRELMPSGTPEVTARDIVASMKLGTRS
jgi:ABC-2 type transport system ATP-binding protein